MKRREFIKILVLSVMGAGAAPEVFAEIAKSYTQNIHDDNIKDYLLKMKRFNKSHESDTWVEKEKYRTFESTVKRLRRLQEYAGHGNYHIMSLDEGVHIARRYSGVGEFKKAELDFLEMLFYSNAALYGFFGHKPVKKLTETIRKNKVIKVPYTGNYLYKGRPVETYEKISKLVGDQVNLTSGVRGVMKQFLLFLNKAYKYNGNLSLASRSLAPPGYSYHGIGDFDVGQKGFGASNFTERFTTTDVYRILVDAGYLMLRYEKHNLLGVRFEPWHIKVADHI
jgi:hypothetical protein